MQAASQSETWGMEWQNLDVSLEEKELAFATFFCGSVESSHWEAISATLKQLDAVYLEMIYSDTKRQISVVFTRRSFLQKLRMFFSDIV